MNAKDFMSEWLLRLLRFVKESEHETQVSRQGHMSTHRFSPKNPVKELTTSHVLRILVNHARLCNDTEKVHEFMDHWNNLGLMIKEFADSDYVDEFNEQFARK